MEKIQPPPPEKRSRGEKTIRFYIDEDLYGDFLRLPELARDHLDRLLKVHPERFPAAMTDGYTFYGFTPISAKLGLRQRRIRLGTTGAVFTLAPSFVLPYLVARTEAVEKAVFLLRFHVPCWALAYVFGHDAMYWYRLQCSFARMSLLGTTVASPEALPSDLLADEKHTRLRGKRAYVALTAGGDCMLGATFTEHVSEAALEQAYGVFAREARDLKTDYSPETVNTDGWQPTQGAWQRLFPEVTVILCFLHAFIKIRDRATKKLQVAFAQVSDRLWQAYRAQNPPQFAQRLRRLREWTHAHVETSPMKTHVLDLCTRRACFVSSYGHEGAHRTSTMVDRLMKFMDRAFFMAQCFHGTPGGAELRVRSLALLWNFAPSSPVTVARHGGQRSPAERLNGKRYAENWLENLLIAGSMNGYRTHQQNPL